jgi:hypothetical protein
MMSHWSGTKLIQTNKERERQRERERERERQRDRDSQAKLKRIEAALIFLSLKIPSPMFTQRGIMAVGISESWI